MSDGSHPRNVGHIASAGCTLDVALDGDLLYVADRLGGLYALRMSPAFDNRAPAITIE